MSNQVQTLRNQIEQTKGRFFTVKFVKKDGTIRTMLARTGVKKGLVGGVSGTAHIPKYFTVYDVNVRQYRNINTETMLSLKCGNKVVWEKK